MEFGNVFDDDPGILNIRKGAATLVSNLTSTDFASIAVDAAAGIATDNNYWNLTGLTTPSTIDGPPFENVLEQFASYAPLWTLCCLTPDQFNNPSSYRGIPSALEHVVFSSAGRYDDKRTTTIVGEPEYYINNFEMKSTIASTEKTGSTNMITMTWDVYEPYSMGYFIHSLQTAAINAGYPNYNGVPFLLKLEFAGHKDNGQMFASTPELEKYFVISFKKVTFTTNEGGSTYKCEAYPANHTGFTNIAQQVKTDLKLRGENIKEMLVAGNDSLCVTLNRAQAKLRKEEKQDTADKYLVVFPENWSDRVGLPGEDNGGSWTEDDGGLMVFDPTLPISAPLVGRTGQDTEDFGTGPIGASSLGFGPSSGGNFNFGFEGDVTDEETGLIVRGSLRIDPKQREFQFKAGASIQNIIQEIVLSSQYAKDAIDPSKGIDAEGRISWFRVDVQIVIGDFDLKRNCRQRTYIFRVLPFKVHSSVFRNPSANPPGYVALNKIIGKEYKYIYTGQNNDIIRFDIQINQLFHQGQMPTSPEDSESVANPAINQSEEEPDQKLKNVDTDDAETTVTPDASPSYGDFAMTKITTKGGPGAQTVARRVAEVLKNKIEKQGTGDMTKISLEVIGDPYWISDSGMGNYVGDVYDGPGGGTDSMRERSGSLNYQGTDTYIRIIFRTPAEPNLGTSGTGGLYNFPPGEKINPYSGIYKVIHCTSKFSDGKFTQTLEATRMPNQPWDYDPYKGPSKNWAAVDITEQDVIDLSPNSDYATDVDYSDLFGVDAGGLGPGYSDEEIAQNNADLGDWEG